MFNTVLTCVGNFDNYFHDGGLYVVQDGKLYCDAERVYNSSKQYSSLSEINDDLRELGIYFIYNVIYTNNRKSLIVGYSLITLCGSTRFKEEFRQTEVKLTLQGYIVLSCNIFTHADAIHLADYEYKMLDAMHRQKIDMSSGICVIVKNGYIGESTKNEIAYAETTGKTVMYEYF